MVQLQGGMLTSNETMSSALIQRSSRCNTRYEACLLGILCPSSSFHSFFVSIRSFTPTPGLSILSFPHHITFIVKTRILVPHTPGVATSSFPLCPYVHTGTTRAPFNTASLPPGEFEPGCVPLETYINMTEHGTTTRLLLPFHFIDGRSTYNLSGSSALHN